MNIKPIAISLTVLALTACATKPKIEPVQERLLRTLLIKLAESRVFILAMTVIH